MTAVILDTTADKIPDPDIFYPGSDGESWVESSDHSHAIATTSEMLLAHLKGQQATVLVDRFLYYVQEFPRLRVAPGGSYKTAKILSAQASPELGQLVGLDREAQRARDLEAQIAIYQQRLVELPPDLPNLLE